MMHSTCPAKINLYLHCTGRREDGYHFLDSLVGYLSLCDHLWLKEKDTTPPSHTEEQREEQRLDLSVTGPFKKEVPLQNNLIIHAAHLMAEKVGKLESLKGLSFSLQKNIPLGAGLGGGSSDAATALILLSRFWNMPLSQEELLALGLKLGADVPLFLSWHFNQLSGARMQGIGEHLTPLSLPSCSALLINPRKQLETPKVFKHYSNLNRHFTPTADFSSSWLKSSNSLTSELKKTHNDLQESAVTLCPEIQDVIELCGTLPAKPSLIRMSGSGATLFALYSCKKEAETAQALLQQKAPDYWSTLVDFRPTLTP